MTVYNRTLQQIGSSILVSIPNEWIKKNQLTKGKDISIETNTDNSISIYNNLHKEEIKIEFEYKVYQNEITSSSDNKGSDIIDREKNLNQKDIKTLLNKIFGAYLLGYNIIIMKSQEQISFDDSETIKGTTRKLIGLEIVDEDSYNIHFQFLIDAKTLNIEKILKMMNSIVAGMFKETIHSLDGSLIHDLKRKIASRDDEIDRQYFLLVRIIRTAIMNKRLANSLELNNIDMLDYRIAANYLETAGDLITELASYITQIKDDKEVCSLIKKIGSSIEEMQYFSIEAFTSTSRDKAFKVLENYEDFKLLISELKKNITSNRELLINETYLIAMVNIISSLDKIAKCWIDVTDLAKPTYMIK